MPEIIAIGVIYSILTVVLQRKLSDMKGMYAIQEEIKKRSAELQRLAKENADVKILEAKQKEVMGMLGKSMKNQFKPMLVVFPMFLLVYYVALPWAFGASATVTIFGNSMGYQTLFIYTVFVAGIVVSMSLMTLDKRKLKEEAKTEDV